MKRFVITRNVTPQQTLALVEWAIANHIPLVEHFSDKNYGDMYYGRKVMQGIYAVLAENNYRQVFPAVIVVREVDADLVLLRL